MAAFDPPRSLALDHELDAFECGEESLNQWLRLTAPKSSASGNARTYVCTQPGSNRVIGFFCLAAGAVSRTQARGRLSRNSPDPIPVIVIGRLAVDIGYQSRGIGKALLVDALRRCAEAADQIGARAVIVNPISNDAAEYYRRRGFSDLPQDPTTQFLLLTEIRMALDY